MPSRTGLGLAVTLPICHTGDALVGGEEDLVVAHTIAQRIRPGEFGEILDDSFGDEAQLHVVLLGLPPQEVEGAVFVDALDEHEHALGLFDGGALLGNVAYGLVDALVVV
ncbi:MAG: hypothetical protein JWR46_3885 [Mycobacterium sp.]|nr:hypothetical protein [Mycobacterium sp.]